MGAQAQAAYHGLAGPRQLRFPGRAQLTAGIAQGRSAPLQTWVSSGKLHLSWKAVFCPCVPSSTLCCPLEPSEFSLGVCDRMQDPELDLACLTVGVGSSGTRGSGHRQNPAGCLGRPTLLWICVETMSNVLLWPGLSWFCVILCCPPLVPGTVLLGGVGSAREQLMGVGAPRPSWVSVATLTA